LKYDLPKNVVTDFSCLLSRSLARANVLNFTTAAAAAAAAAAALPLHVATASYLHVDRYYV